MESNMKQPRKAGKNLKIKAKRHQPIRIGNKIIRLSRQAVVTVNDVDIPAEAMVK
jgi:hypothetical protein